MHPCAAAEQRTQFLPSDVKIPSQDDSGTSTSVVVQIDGVAFKIGVTGIGAFTQLYCDNKRMVNTPLK